MPAWTAPAADRAQLYSTTKCLRCSERNAGLGSPANPQPGRLRYVAQASCLRVLAASLPPVLAVPSSCALSRRPTSFRLALNRFVWLIVGATVQLGRKLSGLR